MPGAHFVGLKHDPVIIVCDRYSAYKKLARLVEGILLAFCWAHVRRDFLNAGRSFAELQGWALEWKERIGTRLSSQRAASGTAEFGADTERASSRPSRNTTRRCKRLCNECMGKPRGWWRLTVPACHSLPRPPAKRRRVAGGPLIQGGATPTTAGAPQPLLEHWPGLTLFLDHPEVPLDNNHAENSLAYPGDRDGKHYYGSGSLWSAQLAATRFSVLQTLELWGVDPRHWFSCYLQACADNGARPPRDLDPFLPWRMEEPRRAELTRPYSPQAPPASPTAPVPGHDRS